ncbi:hypothetical protein [Candidatus Amarobacter glycogenicus]|uniref:hypothetical protein n=1 Tax=Candidatus Amarobacter glycogenicus TaxID=3140699 RepID=UPI003136F804|nr:hypothetical protein [Dehalococcoidia bacterium]
MLDYAANGAVYWPVATLRAAFEAVADDPDGQIASALGPGITSDSLWMNVETNLRAGKLRLVFLADEIPTELRRVVEFLNGQMKAEVLAVEVKQYASPTNAVLRTLVARVYGRTEESADAKGTTASKQWTEEMFFADMADKYPQGVDTAKRLLTWARENGLNVLWGKGHRDRLISGSDKRPAEVRGLPRVSSLERSRGARVRYLQELRPIRRRQCAFRAVAEVQVGAGFRVASTRPNRPLSNILVGQAYPGRDL